MTTCSTSQRPPRNSKHHGLISRALLLGSLLLAVACRGQGGTSQQVESGKQPVPAPPLLGVKYVGDWRRLGTSMRCTEMKIYQTGDIYIVEINANCEGQITKYPATFRDGQLKLSGPRGETALAYIDATGHILLDGSEYERNTRVLAQRGFSYLSQSREANDSPLVASAPIARMRGTYESEETTGVQLEVTSDTMVIKAGPETATIDYKVVSVTAANVTVEIDVKNQGTFNLVIGVREDSLVIERNGVGFLGQGGTWTRR